MSYATVAILCCCPKQDTACGTWSCPGVIDVSVSGIDIATSSPSLTWPTDVNGAFDSNCTYDIGTWTATGGSSTFIVDETGIPGVPTVNCQVIDGLAWWTFRVFVVHPQFGPDPNIRLTYRRPRYVGETAQAFGEYTFYEATLSNGSGLTVNAGGVATLSA